MIDIAIVFLYLALLLLIGITKRSNKNSFKNFSRASNFLQKNKLILVATIFVSSIGGGATFGIAEKAFADDISYSYALLCVIPVDILIAVFIIPRLSKHYGAETAGDIMAIHYGKIGRYITGASAILVSVGLVAAQISVSGRIFEYILQMDYIFGVVMSYCIIIIYTTIGGFQSVLFVNQLQFFVMLTAIPLISIFGLYQVGLSNFIDLVPHAKISLVDNSSLVTSTISAIFGFMAMNLFPTFIQRALINKDSKETSNAIYIKSVFYLFFLICVTLNGLIAFILHPDVKASLALSHLIDHMIPTGLQGLIVAGLLASVMSTADSDLNITSVTIVKDFIDPIFSIKSQRKKLMIARITNILIGSLSILLALCFSQVMDLVFFIVGFWGPVILVPLVMSLYNIVISPKCFAFSCFAGISSFIIWEIFYVSEYNLKSVFVGTMANLIMFMICYIYSKFSKNNRLCKII